MKNRKLLARAFARLDKYATAAAKALEPDEVKRARKGVHNARRAIVTVFDELERQVAMQQRALEKQSPSYGNGDDTPATPQLKVKQAVEFTHSFDFGGMKHACDDVAFGSALAIDALVGESKADAMRCLIGIAVEAGRCRIVGPSDSVLGVTP